jgi:hypothetical protein
MMAGVIQVKAAKKQATKNRLTIALRCGILYPSPHIQRPGLGSPMSRRTNRHYRSMAVFSCPLHGALLAGRAGSREARRFLDPVFLPARSASPLDNGKAGSIPLSRSLP